MLLMWASVGVTVTASTMPLVPGVGPPDFRSPGPIRVLSRKFIWGENRGCKWEARAFFN